MGFADQYADAGGGFADQYGDAPATGGGFADRYADPSAVSFADQYTDTPAKIRMPQPPTSGEQMDQFVGQLGDVGSIMGHAIVPAVAAAGATAFLPELAPGYLGAAISGAGGGVVGGAVQRGVSDLLSGQSLIPDSSTFGNVVKDAAIGAVAGPAMRALPGAARYVGGKLGGTIDAIRDALPLRTAAVDTLPGYAEATSLRAPLPRREDLPITWADEPTMKVNAEDLTMSPLDSARTQLSSPRFLLSRNQDSQAAQIAGDRLLLAGKIARSERAGANAALEGTGVAALSDAERKAALVAQGGRFADLPPEYQTPEVQSAADALRGDLYDAAKQKLIDSGSGTVVTVGPDRGQVVPFQPAPDYVPKIPRDIQPGPIPLAAKLGLRSRPTQTSYQLTGTGQTPAAQALDELRDIVGPIGPLETDAQRVAQAYIEGGKGRIAYPDLVARSYAFGPISEKIPDATHPWGGDANILYQQMLQAKQARDAEMFKNTMDDIYRPDRRSGFEQLMSSLKDRTGHLLLGQTAVKQLSQASTPVWRFGFGNSAKGLYDYAADPSYGNLGAWSGARDAAYAPELGGVGNTIPRAAMASIEGTLRTVANSGVKPYVEGLAAQVQAADAAGLPYNAALRKQLAELRLSPADLRGGVDAPTLSQAFESAAHRDNFHPYAPGESGKFFNDPIGKNLTLYQTFGQSAHRLAQEDVFEPLLGPQGWRQARATGDYSLQKLGAGRMLRLVLAGVPAAAATQLVKSTVALREPDFASIADKFFGTNFGTAGDLIVRTATRGLQGPVEALTQAPAVATVMQQARNIQSGHLERPAYDALALKDRTGLLSAARPLWNNLTKGD